MRTTPAIASSLAAKMRLRARGRTQRQPGQMNKLEAAWAGELERMKRDGQLVAWKYEAVTLTLANRCRFTPDFMLVWHDGEVSWDETKGFMRDDALVKLKVAARTFPWFRFRLVKRGKKGEPYWMLEEVEP